MHELEKILLKVHGNFPGAFFLMNDLLWQLCVLMFWWQE
jgi:hypothetical protein